MTYAVDLTEIAGRRPPIALSIAGSDPSGGAGLQADLKTFATLGVYGAACVTSLTAQNTQGVRDVLAIEPDFVGAQITSVLDDLAVDGVKIGMLASHGVLETVVDILRARSDELGAIVIDPVMISTSGHLLLEEEAVAAAREKLLPLATIVTPNVSEAAMLLDCDPATDEDELAEQAIALVQSGARAAFVKGGHLRGARAVDVLAVSTNPAEVVRMEHPRIRTRNTHGTGCTLSSALAAEYARAAHALGHIGGMVPPDAPEVDLVAVAQAAHNYLVGALESGARQNISRDHERGHGPVDHLHRFRIPA